MGSLPTVLSLKIRGAGLAMHFAGYFSNESFSRCFLWFTRSGLLGRETADIASHPHHRLSKPYTVKTTLYCRVDMKPGPVAVNVYGCTVRLLVPVFTQGRCLSLLCLCSQVKASALPTQGRLLEYILHAYSPQNFRPFSHAMILVGSQGHLFGTLHCQPNSLFCTLFLVPQLRPAFLAGPCTLWLYS